MAGSNTNYDQKHQRMNTELPIHQRTACTRTMMKQLHVKRRLAMTMIRPYTADTEFTQEQYNELFVETDDEEFEGF